DQLRLERKRLPILRGSLVPAAEAGEGDAEITVHLRLSGRQRERPLIARHGLAEAALLQTDVGEHEMSGGVFRAQVCRLHEVSGGIVVAAERSQHLRQVEMAVGIAAVAREGLADEIERGVVATDPECDHAKEMERVDVIAIEGQHVTAEPLGLGDLAGSEMVHRHREQVAGERAGTGWRRGRTAALAALTGCPSILTVHGRAGAPKRAPPRISLPAP